MARIEVKLVRVKEKNDLSDPVGKTEIELVEACQQSAGVRAVVVEPGGGLSAFTLSLPCSW